MEEIWKPIKGYEKRYYISNMGRIYGIGIQRKKRSGFKNSHIDKKTGYLMVTLFDGNKKTSCLVHRLIANAFIPNPENKKYVDHINTIRTDNRIENLRWVTAKENINNPITLQKHIGVKRSEESKMKMRKAQKTMKPVKCVETNKIYISIREAARQTGLHITPITECCNNKRSHHHGFHWVFV